MASIFATMPYSPVWIIASKEIKDGLRNRWVSFITLIFMALSLSVTFAGSAVSGALVLPELPVLISSLSTIAVFIIPLTAILISYDSFVGEEESGTLLLLLSYPLTRKQIIAGKLLGHSIMMAFTSLLGFGITALLLLILGKDYPVGITVCVFSQFILSSILLAMTFILIGYVVSLRSTEKARAIGLLLFVWFLFVLIYDLVLLALLVADLSFMTPELINVLIAFNPTDIYRAINLVAVGAEDLQGTLSLIAQSGLGLSVLYGLLIVWIIGLSILALSVFKCKKL
ncbi:ABC transporter permease [Shewanella marina]|uniref:ABC transporter permease n=1 Tax=Shewanella marina TaxID=487319 RepID=UPI00055BF846|nr:ABC transporter permease subunit [Shewanella marina]